jgi:putative iron-dependent peroxidase
MRRCAPMRALLSVPRPMPWADFSGEGLVFVAFAGSFYAFDAILKRMIGLEDGVVDALFSFSRPLSTSFFWCPPMVKGKPDLSALKG